MYIRGIEPMLPRHGTDEDKGLGTLGWPVEPTIAWLHQFHKPNAVDAVVQVVVSGFPKALLEVIDADAKSTMRGSPSPPCGPASRTRSHA